MRTLIIWGVILGSMWWYATKKLGFENPLQYAKKHPESSLSPKIEFTVGMIYYQRGDYRQAQDVFTLLLTDYPTGQYQSRALLRLSEVAEQNLDYETAKSSLDQFLKDFPEHPDRNMAQKRRELLYNR